jgi:hypothetical protein
MLDHSHTKAILIGNSDYPHWPKGNIPNIRVNLEKLKAALCDRGTVGLVDSPENLLVVADHERTEILVKVAEFTKKCGPEDSLILYYAGHGLLDLDDYKKLYLAAADTPIHLKAVTCFTSDDLKTHLLGCKATNKIMILDCCYAGLAASGLQSDPESVRKTIWGNTKGVYFMMSSDQDEPSRFDPKDDTIPTFFTQRLVQTLDEGDMGGDEIWTLDEFFQQMKRRWDTRIAPEPLRLSLDEVGNWKFCYNRRRQAVAAKNEDVEERRWRELQDNPSDDDLQTFYDKCKDQGLRASIMDFMVRWTDDLALLTAAEKKGPKAISEYIKNGNPCKAVQRMALERLIAHKNLALNMARAPIEAPKQAKVRQPKKSQVWVDSKDSGSEA